jgi:hypothetical protein
VRNLSALLLLLAAVIACNQSGPPARTLPEQSRELINPAKSLTDASFTVSPSGYKYYEFSSSGSHVSGRFKAQGGSGNDIQVFIFDGDGFENWKNHHSATTYYNSGKVTVGTIDAQLGSGTYFLVFDNTFSLFSNKAISSDIKIQ